MLPCRPPTIFQQLVVPKAADPLMRPCRSPTILPQLVVERQLDVERKLFSLKAADRLMVVVRLQRGGGQQRGRPLVVQPLRVPSAATPSLAADQQRQSSTATERAARPERAA